MFTVGISILTLFIWKKDTLSVNEVKLIGWATKYIFLTCFVIEVVAQLVPENPYATEGT